MNESEKNRKTQLVENKIFISSSRLKYVECIKVGRGELSHGKLGSELSFQSPYNLAAA